MLLRLAAQLRGSGVHNHVVSLSKPEPLADLFRAHGLPVVALGMRHSISDMLALNRLRGFLREVRPDVLQGWMYHANAVLSTVRPLLAVPVPLVWNIRRGMDDYRERKFSTRMFIHANRMLSSKPERIIYCTQEAREQHEAFGFDPRRGLVLGNGFNTDEFAPNDSTRALTRKRLGVSDDEILIGNVGRNDSCKGRGFLFDAFAELVERVPHARLLVAGRGLSESNEDVRRALVTRRIAARVILVGECSPISDLYPAMDILCSSSVNEGFPNVIAEGMSAGLACVATDIGNSRELLAGSGIIVPARSASGLAQGLAQLCAETSEARCKRGRRARERIIARYSLSSVRDEYLALYMRLVSEGRGAGPHLHRADEREGGLPIQTVLGARGRR